MRLPGISLKGQAAIVTGARRGIGKETALVLAEAGADVAICDLVSETGELEAVAKEIRDMGRRSFAVKADAGSQSDVEALVARAIREFGTVSILVNNAGIGSGMGPSEPERYEEMRKRMQERGSGVPGGMGNWANEPRITLWNEADWDKVLATNLKGVLIGARAVAPEMVKNRQGAIVNVASVEAFAHGMRELAAYAISKRGIVMVTEGLAADLGRWGIRVNAIAPGGIETEMMRYVWAQPESLKWMEEKMLIGGKLLKPVDCAHLIFFLVSDLAKYVTGQTVVIDAGLTLAPQNNFQRG